MCLLNQDPADLCKVYMKKVDSAIADTATGDGWFKIWDQGYDESTQEWCTKKLIDNGGFLSVDLPKGLVGGYYLVRPELLALHEVPDANNPQYYVGCGQIFLQSSGNLVAASTVAIPGQVHLGDAADKFNIYDEPLKLPYVLPGPAVSSLKLGGSTTQNQQTEGFKPAGCICESGSGFCGVEVPDYDDEDGCYDVSQPWAMITMD
jgi:Auxiliary Activity family 9 (formerly GH61)